MAPAKSKTCIHTRGHNSRQSFKGEIKTADRANARRAFCACAVNHTHRSPGRRVRARKQVTYEQNKDRWPPPPRTRCSGEVASRGERGCPKATGRMRAEGSSRDPVRAVCSGWPRSNNHLFFQVRVLPTRRTLPPDPLPRFRRGGWEEAASRAVRWWWGGSPPASRRDRARWPSTPQHASARRMRYERPASRQSADH